MLFDRLKNKNRFGFSLFEVVVTMSIVAIFIAACSSVFTKRHKAKTSLAPHGRFECYWDENGKLIQRLFSESVLLDESEVEADTEGKFYCTFNPTSNAAYLLITGVGAGGAGGESTGSNTGGSAGEYGSMFLTKVAHEMRIIPGIPAQYYSDPAATTRYDEKGGDTIIIDTEGGTDGEARTVLTLEGGYSNSGATRRLKNCSFAFTTYSCRIEPRCTVNNEEQNVHLTYCLNNGDDASVVADTEQTISFKASDSGRGDYLLKQISNINDFMSADKMMTYICYSSCDENDVCTCTGVRPSGETPLSYFTLAFQFDGNFLTSEQAASEFYYYMNALGLLELEDGIGKVAPTPGLGGGRGYSGGTGAVIITW